MLRKLLYAIYTIENHVSTDTIGWTLFIIPTFKIYKLSTPIVFRKPSHDLFLFGRR